jgi:hypothetical protein
MGLRLTKDDEDAKWRGSVWPRHATPLPIGAQVYQARMCCHLLRGESAVNFSRLHNSFIKKGWNGHSYINA